MLLLALVLLLVLVLLLLAPPRSARCPHFQCVCLQCLLLIHLGVIIDDWAFRDYVGGEIFG